MGGRGSPPWCPCGATSAPPRPPRVPQASDTPTQALVTGTHPGLSPGLPEKKTRAARGPVLWSQPAAPVSWSHLVPSAKCQWSPAADPRQEPQIGSLWRPKWGLQDGHAGSLPHGSRWRVQEAGTGLGPELLGPAPGVALLRLCYLGGSREPGSLRVCHCAHTTTQSTPPPRPPRRGLVGGNGWHSRGLAGTARLGRGRTMARGSPRPLPRALHCAGELGPQAAPSTPPRILAWLPSARSIALEI